MNDVYVISCQRNANKHSIHCLESVRQQTVQVKKHFFIDDMSIDNTIEIVNNHLSNPGLERVHFITNERRKYRLKNIDDAIESIDDSSAIVCLLDGDDWLASPMAIEVVRQTYEKNPALEYVYTNWMYSHNNELGISKPIPSDGFDVYRDPWITSAMATFKVGAYKAIPKSNFLDEAGEYFKMGTDHAYVLPLVHMLKEKYGNYKAVGFIDAPLYVYQFIENAMRRRRDSEEGHWETRTAAESSQYIRKRGFIND